MVQAFTGGCLCSAVRYSCTDEPAMAGHCHCEDCRRSSGSGHSSHLLVTEASVTLTGRTQSYARPADSGNLVSRHFCPTCGAALFSRNAAMPGMIFLRASSLDDLEVSSVKKKLKDKAFARSVNRDDIRMGVEELGVPLEDHIRFVIDALRPVQKEIGLNSAGA